MKAAIAIAIVALGGCAKVLGLDPTHTVECTACGADSCVDVMTDPMHCGDCVTTCTSDELCTAGQCVPSAPCDSGATESCYTGASGTEGVGPCHHGTRTCSGGHWGACEGEVVPALDVCGDTIDQDCSGAADDPKDADGDGFSTCAGDCCDAPGQGCADPSLVNPNAFDVAGNHFDDDCNGMIDDAPATCDMALVSSTPSAMDLVQAIDLCKGVTSSALTLTDGTGTPTVAQHAPRPVFGAFTPRAGMQLLVLSTGNAAAPGQMNPMFVAPQNGTTFTTMSAFPADWLAAHNGMVPLTPGCPAPTGTVANDPVLLTLHVKVPINARSFRLSLAYLTAEYPEFICSAFNDEALVLLDSTWSGTPANPPDKNIAVYRDGTGDHLLDSNLAKTTALFQDCKLPGPSCPAPFVGSCSSDTELAGTGFEVADPMNCGGGTTEIGAGTGWLVARGNVVGGETITLRIALWDTSDHIFDSDLLLDGFTWSPDTITPGLIRE